MRNHKLLPLLLFVLILGFNIPSYAQFGQPDSKQSDNDFKMSNRLYIGGGLGFGMSSYSTSVWITPVIGYRLSPSVDIGTRLSYNFYSSTYYTQKYSTHNYGGALFARYYLFFFNDLFLHAEYEALSYQYGYPTVNGDIEKRREWISGFFIGGGYRQWIGSNAFVGITVLWNVLDDLNSPYSNPIFRIGVGVGI
jgi:hypothetical protein